MGFAIGRIGLICSAMLNTCYFSNIEGNAGSPYKEVICIAAANYGIFVLGVVLGFIFAKYLREKVDVKTKVASTVIIAVVNFFATVTREIPTFLPLIGWGVFFGLIFGMIFTGLKQTTKKQLRIRRKPRRNKKRKNKSRKLKRKKRR